MLNGGSSHHKANRLTLAVDTNLYIQPSAGVTLPPLCRRDSDPGERQVLRRRTCRGRDGIEPRVCPGCRRHLIRFDLDFPEYRVIPGHVPVLIELEVGGK